ncbi:3-isopropylmalate dehydratase large subunit [Anabaena subtropica]|uniref:3-isopropylmalate dehydratase n=1 Tax=Anabaena subtropica FACHB-260 TaxID=2692884 RepID=A0ABR8CIR1_9NOST|nr:3-isopropylmalate dehydratase large subunit [Anabaena subtropica FACHB-260]
MGKSLYEKVFEYHTIKQLPSGLYQILVGLHLIHEATSPQAFSMLQERNLNVMFPDRTFATVDHIIPTSGCDRPLSDPLAEDMLVALEKNTAEYGIKFFSPNTNQQGIIHVIAPEKGLTQPGMIICCGDSHTSTHGAFGAIALGIGTTQIRDVLASQTLAMPKLKVRRIDVNGKLKSGVYAKDVILHIINHLGAKAGVGYAYEYGGDLIDNLSMDERMTICNMSIEGGARCGYINPDQKTYDYLQGREFAPQENSWKQAIAYWESIKSDPDTYYDDRVMFKAEDIEPMVTWGISSDQSIGINETIPSFSQFHESERNLIAEAYQYMSFQPGASIKGTKIDVAFIGSCSNGRFSDLETVAQLLIQNRGLKVSPHVKALIVPGSQQVRAEIIKHGYDKVFQDAGFEFRESGCSMCVGINPDKLIGNQICASSSTRNFKGRQGSPQGRTLLMSPVMVAAAAIAGELVDARNFWKINSITPALVGA